MKRENTLRRSEGVSLEASQLCCLARVNALLKSLRVRHSRADLARLAAEHRAVELGNHDVHVPTAHDLHVAELEASVAPELLVVAAALESAIACNDPAEVARARLVFAASLVVPLLLITTGLALFDEMLGRALSSLLHFSALALATPLVLVLARTVLQGSWQGIHHHPLMVLTGIAAAAGYATSAFAMTGAGAGASSVAALSTAGLLVLAVQFWRWLLARKTLL